jgi:hypothetical protein
VWRSTGRRVAEESPPLSRMEQIQILMAEYNTLRTEILQAGSTTVAIGVIVAAYSPFFGATLLLVLPLIIFLAWRVVDFDTKRNAIRLRELEAVINRLAGSRLLAWETDHGGVWPEANKQRIEHVVSPFVQMSRHIRDRLSRSRSN